MKTIGVAVRATDPRRYAEALRAAVGLTLRGDRVALVLLAPPPRTEAVARALATLATLGHQVAAPPEALRDADVIEVWR